jgi:HEAT repeat protein
MFELETLRARLRDDDESARAFAAEDAGFDDLAVTIAPLLERLDVEPSRFVREAIVAALSRMTQSAICGQVVPLLSSEDAYLRNAGVSILQSKGDAALEVIELLLASPDTDARKLALDALSGIGSAQAAGLLVRGLGDGDVNVRIAALEYIGDRGRGEAKEAVEALFEREQEPMLLSTALAALEAIGDAATWEVIERRFARLEDVPPYLCAHWLRVLGKWGHAASLEAFLAGAQKIGPALVGDLCDGLESFHDRHQFHALPPGGLYVLRGLFGSASAAAKFRLLKWFGRLDGEAGVFELLASYLDDAEAVVRDGAVLGLRRLGTTAAREALSSRHPREGDADVRASIELALADPAPAAALPADHEGPRRA